MTRDEAERRRWDFLGSLLVAQLGNIAMLNKRLAVRYSPGLRLSLPLQSRPAQISDGTPDSTEQLELREGNIAIFPIYFTSIKRRHAR